MLNYTSLLSHQEIVSIQRVMTGTDMAVGPVFVTQTNPTHHFFNPTQPNLPTT